MDSDLMFVSDEVRTLLPIIDKFGICCPQNERQMVRVDGIYTADPEKDETAKMYDSISFDEVYKKGLKVMDLTAFTLCKENNLPIKVFNMNLSGKLRKICSGKKVGTLVNF